MANTTPERTLGEKLKRARDAVNTSNVELDNRTNIPRESIRRKLDGDTELTLGQLRRLASAVGLDPVALYAEYVEDAAQHEAEAAA